VFYLCKEYENHLKTIIKNIENIIDVIFHIREELLVLEITKNKKSKIDIYVVSPLGANTTPLVSVIE
jgi:light-regulated signal transduction histidine kinase (bacteriophytochrome)